MSIPEQRSTPPEWFRLASWPERYVKDPLKHPWSEATSIDKTHSAGDPFGERWYYCCVVSLSGRFRAQGSLIADHFHRPRFRAYVGQCPTCLKIQWHTEPVEGGIG